MQGGYRWVAPYGGGAGVVSKKRSPPRGELLFYLIHIVELLTFVYHSSQITKIDIGIKSTHSPILDFYPRKSAQMFNIVSYHDHSVNYGSSAD